VLILLQGEYTVGAQGTETMLNSLMYRTSYYDFGKVRPARLAAGTAAQQRNCTM
jgi:hypothetical protein